MKLRKQLKKLARRIAGYDALQGQNVHKGDNYHRPGSRK